MGVEGLAASRHPRGRAEASPTPEPFMLQNDIVQPSHETGVALVYLAGHAQI